MEGVGRDFIAPHAQGRPNEFTFWGKSPSPGARSAFPAMTRVVAIAGERNLTLLLHDAFGSIFPMIDISVVGEVLRDALRTDVDPDPKLRMEFLKARLAALKGAPHVLLVLNIESDEEFVVLHEWAGGGVVDKYYAVKDNAPLIFLTPDVHEVAHINDRQFVQTFDEIISPSSI
jgi:hypothetical protein